MDSRINPLNPIDKKVTSIPDSNGPISTTDYHPPDNKQSKFQDIYLDPSADASLQASLHQPKLLATTTNYIPGMEEDDEFTLNQEQLDLTNLIGITLDNTYKLETHIGSGGMAYVFSATDIQNNRKCAVKIMKAANPGSIDKNLLRRFMREGKTMQKLVHSNILQIYNLGNDHGLKYIAMELLEGGTLRLPKTSLTPKQKLFIVADICDALQYAHDNSVIHRDIKPENILLSTESTSHNGQTYPIAKLSDFGLVLIPDASRISRSNDILGSAYYMSPEQAGGERNLTGFADLYSIGIVLYELVTGKVPFDGGGNFLSVLEQQKSADPIPPRQFFSNDKERKASKVSHKLALDTLPGLEPIIMTLLKKKPEHRLPFEYPSILAHRLREIASTQNTKKLNISPPP